MLNAMNFLENFVECMCTCAIGKKMFAIQRKMSVIENSSQRIPCRSIPAQCTHICTVYTHACAHTQLNTSTHYFITSNIMLMLSCVCAHACTCMYTVQRGQSDTVHNKRRLSINAHACVQQSIILYMHDCTLV